MEEKSTIERLDKAIFGVVEKMIGELEELEREKKPIILGEDKNFERLMRVIKEIPSLKAALKEDTTPVLTGKAKQLEGKVTRRGNN